MKLVNILGLAAALTALTSGALLADTTTITAAPANFQGDSSGATAQVGANGPGSTKFLDVEGAGNGRFAAFGVIDFTGNSVYNTNGNAETITNIDPHISLALTDATFSQSRPTGLNFYLSDSSAPLSSLRYLTSDTSATAGVGNQLNHLFFLGAGFDTSPARLGGGQSRVGSLLTYDLTLPSAAQSYFIQQLNADYNPLAGDTTPANLTNLRLVITSADPANPNGVAAFSGSTGPGAPTLTFSTNVSPVPEPSQYAVFGVMSFGLLGLAFRKRLSAKTIA